MINELNLQGVTANDLVVANQKHGQISEIFGNKTSCDDIDQDRDYTMVYHVPNQTEDSSIVEFNFFKQTRGYGGRLRVDLILSSAPRLFAIQANNTIMDIKRMVLEKMRGVFAEVPENDEELNEMIEVHVRENLRSRYSYNDDYTELMFNKVKTNKSVETASDVNLEQILDRFKPKRHLILAIVLKNSGNKFIYGELRCKYRQHSNTQVDSDDEDNTLAGRTSKAINLATCFAGFSTEEILSGDDQWYCNICKEHRDITKKLEIYSTPKIFVIQLKRFQ